MRRHRGPRRSCAPTRVRRGGGRGRCGRGALRGALRGPAGAGDTGSQPRGPGAGGTGRGPSSGPRHGPHHGRPGRDRAAQPAARRRSRRDGRDGAGSSAPDARREASGDARLVRRARSHPGLRRCPTPTPPSPATASATSCSRSAPRWRAAILSRCWRVRRTWCATRPRSSRRWRARRCPTRRTGGPWRRRARRWRGAPSADSCARRERVRRAIRPPWPRWSVCSA